MTHSHMPSTMGKEWLCLLEQLARPTSHIDRHRKRVALGSDTNRADQPLLGGAVCPVLLASSLPSSVTVETNKVRLVGAQGTVHLLEGLLPLQTHDALLGEGVNSPVPILHPDDSASKG